MHDVLSRFESFARRTVRFRCKPPKLGPQVANYPEIILKAMGTIPPPDARFEITVAHHLRAPASKWKLRTLRSLLGPCAPQFEAFYAKHDGFILYKDPDSNTAALEAIEIGQWKKATKFMRGMMGELPPELNPGGPLSAIAFAAPSSSGNFFVVSVSGAQAGKIFYANHEDWNPKPFARSFNEFLERVMSEPIALFSKLGTTARYADKAGCIQWIPESVL